MGDVAGNAKRLSELAAIIATNTKKIEDFLAQEGLPHLTFDPSGPGDFPVPSKNEDIQKARRTVVNATQELHDLMVGPREHIRWLTWSYNDNLSLQAVWQFKVAQAVPRDGDISYADLAKAVGVNLIDIRRLVRHAMTNRIFRESRDGYVAHTAPSIILLDDKAMNDWVGVCSSQFFPAAARTVDAMVKYPASQEASESGFSEAWCPGKPMFGYLGGNPELARMFGGAMASLTGGEGYEVSYVVDNYPWEEINERGGVVVDVGGSIGFVCVALAQKYPNLRFYVQDLPKTVANGPDQVPESLRDRITFQAHDFYTPQPVKDADVYFFRWICHNQSDKYGVKMMQSLIPALKPGARIVISDNCLPVPGTVDNWDDKITRSMDVTMLQLLNSKERDDADWTELFRMADPSFRYLGSKTPKGSRMSIMEAVWEPAAANGTSTSTTE